MAAAEDPLLYQGIMPPILLAVVVALLVASQRLACGCYTGIFVFGDAYSDAGNDAIRYGLMNNVRLPYGMTYFHRPTGRFCDGRIIPDLLAEAFGLPFPPPSFGIPPDHDVRRGVNFALAGATALDYSFFADKGVRAWTNYTLRAQIAAFKQLLPSICSATECRDVIGTSLFLVGEIGINDFNDGLSNGREVSELWTYVPSVVQAITSAVKDLIEIGARTLVVPGLYPNGCLPTHLTRYSEMAKDPATGCIKGLNNLAEHYNLQLHDALRRLRVHNPHATIVYADLYRSAMRLIADPLQYGFDRDTLKVCCGGGGPYNYNESAKCGDQGSTVCADPSKAVFWIRYQFTEAAYKFMAQDILQGPDSDPPISHLCPHIRDHVEGKAHTWVG